MALKIGLSFMSLVLAFFSSTMVHNHNKEAPHNIYENIGDYELIILISTVKRNKSRQVQKDTVFQVILCKEY